MRIFLLMVCASVLLLAGSLASAQVSTPVVIVPQNSARLTWTWTQGTGCPPAVSCGAVTEFHVKCGTAPGQYTTTTVIADPAARSVLVSVVENQVGKYYCAVSAANQFGESGLSNEVGFQSGFVPVAPTNHSVSGS